MQKVAIVTTSIGNEEVFKKFFKAYSQLDISGLSPKLIVIGDLNSPKLNFESMPEYHDFIRKGFEFEYWDVEKQKKIMSSKPYMEDLIPWKRIQRRNIGFLIAYKQNYEIIIAVDDDNFPIAPDFIRTHLDNLIQKNVYLIKAKDKNIQWLNPCIFLENHIIHRGFPLKYRYQKPETIIENINNANIMVSEGFWKGDPDIDALSRLEGNPSNINIENIIVKNFCISPELISPFNSQNTALRREMIPAFFLNAKVGRYDDIWPSYFIRVLLMIKGDLVMYGNPIVRQDRNDHDIIKDLENEIFGMRNTEEFVNELLQLANERKDFFSKLDYMNLTKEIASQMLFRSKFSWFYVDILRWIELLED